MVLWSFSQLFPLSVYLGVNLCIMPEICVALSRLGLCHRTAAASPLTRAATATRSEGAGAVILKTLSRAQRDGDGIYALIMGSAVNSDGRTNIPITAPSSITQAALMRQVYSRAGIDPTSVQYVEAHGTGTLRYASFCRCCFTVFHVCSCHRCYNHLTRLSAVAQLWFANVRAVVTPSRPQPWAMSLVAAGPRTPPCAWAA